MDPLALIAAWPRQAPIAALVSGAFDPRFARWSILAAPTGRLVHVHNRTSGIGSARQTAQQASHDPLRDLDLIWPLSGQSNQNEHIPFTGGWIGALSYRLGRIIEPMAASARAPTPDDRPVWEWLHCPKALVYDHAARRWSRVENGCITLLDDDDDPRNALWGEVDFDSRPCEEEASLSPWQALTTRREIEQRVSRTLDYIGAGDIYQANIAQEWTCQLTGSPGELFIRTMQQSPARYGALLDFGERSIVSLSPELFLDLDSSSGLILTRPIKGTTQSDCSTQTLQHSVKDRAELAMIVDLMRNDLGRVCAGGTVQVTTPRDIETHTTVHHAVGTVQGRLRQNLSLSDVIQATFPPGSVTGAPKIRAMQIIDELETTDRGVYTGAIGSVSEHGKVQLNVAIRTMQITGAEVRYHAGAGIVADSKPTLEYEEILAKRAAVDGLTQAPSPLPV